MAIRITCPGCETSLRLGDDKRGKKIRCPECEKVLSIPSANGKVPKPKPQDDDDLVESDDDEEDEEEEREARKKKRKPFVFPIFWVGIAAAVLVLLGGGGGLTYYLLNRPPPPRVEPQAKVDPPKVEGPAGGVPKTKPKSLFGNIRARALGTARDAEMEGIVALHLDYCETFKNPQTRTLDNFLQSIRTVPAETIQRIREKYYTINLQARPLSDDVVVFETELYTEGYYCFQASKKSGFVSEQDMIAARLIAPRPPD